jgi:hypothetical protein
VRELLPEKLASLEMLAGSSQGRRLPRQAVQLAELAPESDWGLRASLDVAKARSRVRRLVVAAIRMGPP